MGRAILTSTPTVRTRDRGAIDRAALCGAGRSPRSTPQFERNRDDGQGFGAPAPGWAPECWAQADPRPAAAAPGGRRRSESAGTTKRSSNGTEILISSKFVGGLSYDAGARVLTMEHGEVEIGTERGQACFCLLVRPCRRIRWRQNGASRGCWADYRFR